MVPPLPSGGGRLKVGSFRIYKACEGTEDCLEEADRFFIMV